MNKSLMSCSGFARSLSFQGTEELLGKGHWHDELGFVVIKHWLSEKMGILGIV